VEHGAQDHNKITRQDTHEGDRSVKKIAEQSSGSKPVNVNNYKVEDYDFRKLDLFTVPVNKIEEFESLDAKRIEMDKAMGLKHNYIVFKAMYGYPVNTYLVFVPDRSKLDYYKHADERNAQRRKNKDYVVLAKQLNQLRTSIRMDHLSRIQN
jgi:hypothetical protein